jgi:transposase
MMPDDLPHWTPCHHYFRLWAKRGYWKKIHHAIRDRARQAPAKNAPTAAISDSHSVRTASQSGVNRDDALKKITVRRRHILVNTQSTILAFKVTTADAQDRDGPKLLLNVLAMAGGWLMPIWANGGYAGKLI